MEPIHIFHKELRKDENNIFVSNLAEKSKVESVKFKKSREYAVTGLSINQDTGNLIEVTNRNRKKYYKN